MATGTRIGGKGNVPKEAANKAATVAAELGEGNPPPPTPAGLSNVHVGVSLADVRDMIADARTLLAVEYDNLKHSIDKRLARLDDFPTKKELVVWGVGTILTLIALFLGVLFATITVVGDRWDNGLTAGTTLGGRLERADQSLDDLNKKIDRLFEEDAKKK